MSIANSFLSRVTQLDSMILDKEFNNFVRNQLISIFDKLQLSNWVEVYQAEFDFIVSTIIYQLTIGLQQCSIGQRLLGVQYLGRSRRLTWYYIFSVVFPYLHARIGSFLARRESPILNLNLSGAVYTKRVNTGWKIAQILNFFVFLQENKYASLSHRFSGLKMIPSHQRLPFPPGDSFQIRELLWHQFSDFLMIVVPFVNLHLIRRYWSLLKNYWYSKSYLQFRRDSRIAELSAPKPDVVAKCCYCNQDAVIPQHLGDCSFCYYCLKANQLVDKNFQCHNCEH